LVAVTRGLLDTLDDDELAAVLAHEASHIRQGDTKLLAANHALMRTAVILQMENPLRFENWRQLILPLLVPPMLLVMLAGSAASALSMQLSRAARRGLKLGRDYIADSEAIRVTHFPEALLSAIAKIGGRGAFEGSYRVEGLLFDGRADHEGGSHPAIRDRLDAIRTLGRELMNPARLRRDSRVPSRPLFGRRPRMAATAYPLHASGRPLAQPQRPSKYPLLLYFTDRETFWQWQDARFAWTECQLRERRNVLGLAPKLMIPLAVSIVVALFLWWPKDGNLSRLVTTFNPTRMVDLVRMVNSEPLCTGPSYPDGKCPGAKNAGAAQAQANAPAAKVVAQAERKAPASGALTRISSSKGDDPDWAPPGIFRVLMLAFAIVAVTRPSLLRKLFGAIEPLKTDLSKFGEFDTDEAEKVAAHPPPNWNVPPPPRSAPPAGRVNFGRRN
jgi:heat shock protein HtpX